MSLKLPPSLDPGFQPAVLCNRNYVAAVNASGEGVPLVLGLERECQLVSRFETVIRPKAEAETLRYVERVAKFLLWSRGGWKLLFGGPKSVAAATAQMYSGRGTRKVDGAMMAKSYRKRFQVVLTSPSKVPATRDMQVAAGGILRAAGLGSISERVITLQAFGGQILLPGAAGDTRSVGMTTPTASRNR